MASFMRGWKIALAAIGAYTAGTYVVDVLLRPHLVANEAQRFAKTVGKPVLNVGAGTPRSSLRVALIGPTTWGDVNCDIAANETSCGSDRVCYCDATKLPYPDKTFGAIIASHVLEHLRDPKAAVAEWDRVAERSFIIVPKWWAAHTWAHPGHRWFINDKFGMFPLWG